MGWLLLLMIVAVIGYFFYARRTGSVRLSKKQVQVLQDVLDQERAKSGAKKQRLVDQAAKAGKTIPLDQIVAPLERSKDAHKDDPQYIAAVDRTINELKRRYESDVPVDKAYPFITEDEEEQG